MTTLTLRGLPKPATPHQQAMAALATQIKAQIIFELAKTKHQTSGLRVVVQESWTLDGGVYVHTSLDFACPCGDTLTEVLRTQIDREAFAHATTFWAEHIAESLISEMDAHVKGDGL